MFHSRTFLPSSLASHQKMCTSDNPMIKQNKEGSYAARAGAKVSYPKLSKSKDVRKPDNNNEQDTKEPSPPTRQEIINVINDSKVLDNPKHREELMKMMQTFLTECN